MANIRFVSGGSYTGNSPFGPISVYREQVILNPQAAGNGTSPPPYGSPITDTYADNSIPRGAQPCRITGSVDPFQPGNTAPYTTSQPLLDSWDEHQRGKQGAIHDTNAAIYQV